MEAVDAWRRSTPASSADFSIIIEWNAVVHTSSSSPTYLRLRLRSNAAPGIGIGVEEAPPLSFTSCTVQCGLYLRMLVEPLQRRLPNRHELHARRWHNHTVMQVNKKIRERMRKRAVEGRRV